jgi:hypothetical protein
MRVQSHVALKLHLKHADIRRHLKRSRTYPGVLPMQVKCTFGYAQSSGFSGWCASVQFRTDIDTLIGNSIASL